MVKKTKGTTKKVEAGTVETVIPQEVKEFVEATPEETAKGISKVPQVTVNVPEGKVLVNDDGLKKVLERMDFLEAKVTEQQKEIAATADKAKLERYRSSISPKGGQIVRLGVLDGLVVTGWLNMPSNICEKNERGLWNENQTRILIMEDGTEKRGAYSEFNKHITHIDATVTARKKITTDIGEQEILTVAAENGKDYDIDVRFVNP